MGKGFDTRIANVGIVGQVVLYREARAGVAGAAPAPCQIIVKWLSAVGYGVCIVGNVKFVVKIRLDDRLYILIEFGTGLFSLAIAQHLSTVSAV